MLRIIVLVNDRKEKARALSADIFQKPKAKMNTPSLTPIPLILIGTLIKTADTE
jgi:hypothetical protein